MSSPVVPEVYGLSEQTLASNEAQIQPAPEVPKNTVVAEQTLAQASLDSPSVVAQQSSGVQAPVTAAQSASMLLAENTFQVSRAPITPNQIVGREGPSLPENLYFQTRGRNV